MSTELPIPPGLFAKDHWSLLAYIDVCCASGRPVDRRRLRCNPQTHPLLAHIDRWERTWGTRLADGWQGADHDDWDCLDDLEVAGLLEVISAINGIVRLSTRGERVALALRAHKELGGTFADFNAKDYL